MRLISFNCRSNHHSSNFNRSGLLTSSISISMYRFYKDTLFISAVIIYSVNRFLYRYCSFSFSFTRNYLSDVLLIPCTLPPILFLIGKAGYRSKDKPANFIEIFICLFIWSISFEVIAPLLTYGISDYRDIICYWIGGIISGFIWQRQDVLHS